MKKRITAVLMIAAMLMVCGPVQAFAATEDATLGSAPKLAKVTKFKALSSNKAVVLTWKKVPNATGYVINWSGNGKKGKITINDGNKKSYTHSVPLDKKFTYSIVAVGANGAKSSEAAKCTGDAVRTLHLKITFKTNRTLTSHSGGRVKTKFKAGTQKTATGFSKGKYVFKHKGRTYNVVRISVRNAKVSQLSRSRKYSAKEAESYVNSKGLKSSTKYLIWVNTYTQREYIFKGSKGNWKCVKSAWQVATGKPSTPTTSGLTRIKSKMIAHGVPYWNVCSVFSIHGNTPKYWGGLGYPKSGACVRNTNEHAKWIYYNCKVGTAVYVF